MVNYIQAKQSLLKAYPNFKITFGSEAKDKFIFAACPKNIDPNEWIGGHFQVFKSTGKISGYSPTKNPTEFKQALNNPIE